MGRFTFLIIVALLFGCGIHQKYQAVIPEAEGTFYKWEDDNTFESLMLMADSTFVINGFRLAGYYSFSGHWQSKGDTILLYLSVLIDTATIVSVTDSGTQSQAMTVSTGIGYHGVSNKEMGDAMIHYYHKDTIFPAAEDDIKYPKGKEFTIKISKAPVEFDSLVIRYQSYKKAVIKRINGRLPNEVRVYFRDSDILRRISFKYPEKAIMKGDTVFLKSWYYTNETLPYVMVVDSLLNITKQWKREPYSNLE